MNIRAILAAAALSLSIESVDASEGTAADPQSNRMTGEAVQMPVLVAPPVPMAAPIQNAPPVIATAQATRFILLY
jgi:hypothetical protein